MAFLSSLGSTNEVDTANIQVSVVSKPDSTVNLEQIHEDDLEEIDLKWQLALLSMRARRYFQRTSKKITINGSDTAGYEKTNVKCFNYHKMGHFARECRSPRNQESRPRNQDSLRKSVNVEDTSSKAMSAIDGAGFDWSYMADDKAPTNMALMAFSDSKLQNSKTCSNTCFKSFETLKTQYDNLRINFNKSEFDLSTYKRGLASVEEQLVFYKKNEVMFCDQIAMLKRDASFRDSKINALNLQIEKLKKEKGSNQIKLENFENASKSLDKLIGSLFAPPTIDLSNSGLEEFQHPKFKGYGPKDSKSVYVDTSNEIKKAHDTLIIEDWVSDSDDDESEKFEYKVNTAKENSVNTAKGNRVTSDVRKQEINAVKSSACWVWRPKIKVQDHVSKNSGSYICKRFDYVDLEGRLKSAYARNIFYLTDFKEHDVGYVTFGEEQMVVRFRTATKNETSRILKSFITEIENLVDKKVKIIQCDNGTKFKNRVMNEFCEEKDQLGKFDGKSDEGIFVGYSTISKAFRVYNTRTRKVEENLHIIFLENEPMIAGGGSECQDYIFMPLWKENSLFDSSSQDSDGHNKDKHGLFQESECDTQKRPNAKRSTKTVNTAGLVNIATPTYADYPSDPLTHDLEDTRIFDDAYDDRDEGAEADYNNLETVISVGPIPSTRVHKDHPKEQIIGEVHSAVQTRKMAKQNEAGLLTFINKQRRTNHKDFQNYLFACFLFLPKKVTQALDDENVKSAFLYGTTEEEVYVSQPSVFVDPEFSDRVYKVEKALYGLHQALKACVKSASTPMETHKPLSKLAAGTDVDVHLYRYLKGQPTLVLWYPKDLPLELIAYSDCDYTGASIDKKSTTGGYQCLGLELKGCLINDGCADLVKLLTRSERVLKQPNEPPLPKGHTSRSGEVRMEQPFELTHTVPPTPHDSPITGGYILGCDEGRLKLLELMNTCTTLSNRVTTLENEISSTKVVYHKAFITLTKKVKKLETQLKQKRSRAVIHSSDEEEPILDAEDSPKQRRMIGELDKDETINLVSEQGEVQEIAEPLKDDDDATLAETLLNIKRSTTKDKSKGIMQETKLPRKIKKREMIQLSLNEELALKLHAKKLTNKTARQEQERSAFNLQQESLKKQKLDEQTQEEVEAQVDTDKEIEEMKLYVKIVPGEYIAINAIPLATKPLVIVKYKILKEGKICIYHIIRADEVQKDTLQ
nr:ribonuclease H-like domain-containing protein [Tanacetum cinerariifolium]